ncbi:GlxA family transcriptional regulator [Natronoglycomyces albus]|uniref:Helix-turn-helix domain-containing protein n=1 Tax=Natronoglycomyces albus TaxID=2811108 RepID=A0A895XU17_9ACTN|nr:helix-turn-helix domain-containing protein [Natronoglycomyces albus]QSB06825.1 helix-turn-helix domain-containing protein [Natronoglycomyces albus]
MSRVAVLVAGRLLHFELAVACEIFGRPLVDGPDGWYEVQLCGPASARVGPFVVEPQVGLEGLVGADVVVVPALADVGDVPSGEVIEALRAAHAAGARVVSLCTGAFVLGAAGLLDGRRVTTHWAHARELGERFGGAVVDADVLYTDNGSVLTSAGKAAAVDVCLHVVQRDFGASVANAVARRLVVPPHRLGGQAQFVTSPVPGRAGDALAPVLEWALSRLDRPLSVVDMAREANMSSRHLARRFRAVTGQTPMRWLLVQRVRRAQELLEATDLSVVAVAVATGLGTATTLRRQFKAVVGVAPDAYRRAFRHRE